MDGEKNILLLLSDIHGDERFLDKWEEYLRVIDLIIISGDLSRQGSKLKEILEILGSLDNKCLVIPGNNETPEMIDKFKPENVINLHKSFYETENFVFVGFGGSKKTPFSTNFEWEENEVEHDILELANLLKEDKINFFITHSPPWGCLLDNYTLGSKVIRKFIENYKPDFCICGHIHEREGCMCKIGKTICINPGKRGILLEI